MNHHPAYETGISVHYKALALGGYFQVPVALAMAGLRNAGWIPHRRVACAWSPGQGADEIATPMDKDRWLIAHRFRSEPNLGYLLALGRQLFGSRPVSVSVRAPGFRIPVLVDPALYAVANEPARSVRVCPHEDAPPFVVDVGGIAHELCLRAVRDERGVSFVCDIEVGPRYVAERRRARRATYLGDLIRPFAATAGDEVLTALAVMTLYTYALNLPGVRPIPGRPGNLNPAAHVIRLPSGIAGFRTELPGPFGPRRFLAFGTPPWLVPISSGMGSTMWQAEQALGSVPYGGVPVNMASALG